MASENRPCPGALEATCGGGAPPKHVLQQKIRVAHEACRGVKDPDTYYTLNELFHGALYEASQNDFLIEKVRRIQRQVRPYRRLQLRVRSRLANSFTSIRKSWMRSWQETATSQRNGCGRTSMYKDNGSRI